MAYESVLLAISARDYQAAEKRLLAAPSGPFSAEYFFVPTAQLAGRLRELLKDPPGARRVYEAARDEVERKLREDPEDSRYYSTLGLTLAGLGLKQEAIRAGARATEMLPVSRDAMIGPYRVEDLARIYAMVGEPDLALDQLEYLMSIPAEFGYGAMKLDPAWDPLRGHPRLQRLLERAGAAAAGR